MLVRAPILARATRCSRFLVAALLIVGAHSCKSRATTRGGETVADPASWLAVPVVPAALAPPPEAKLLAHFHAKGSQIYLCKLSPQGAPAWTLKAPDADLFDRNGIEAGTHGAGPSWSLRDGSHVTAKKLAQADAPSAGAIPWLLLQVTSATGNGLLSTASYIQRVQTARGTTPVGGCLGATMGNEVRIDYAAEYYFYSGGAPAAPSTDGP